MDGVRARRAVPERERVRASRTRTRQRLAAYPVEEWLTAEPDVIFDATKEAFPDITRAHFITDLHQIARRATDEARADGSPTGWVAHTTTGDGRGPDELSFWFEQLPLEHCPPPRASRSRSTAPTVAPEAEAIGAQTGIDPARVQAWQTAVVDAYWCATGTASGFTHEIGRAPSFAPCVCAGRHPRTITTKTPPPPPVWEPGQPIPEEIP